MARRTVRLATGAMVAAATLALGTPGTGASTITYVRDGRIVAVSDYAGTDGTSSGTGPSGITFTTGTVVGGSGSSSGTVIGGPGTGGTGTTATGSTGTGDATVRTATFSVGTPGSGTSTAGQRAYQALAARDLPTPAPRLVPARAITGVRSYLRIGGATTAAFTLLDPLGTGGAIAYDCRTTTATVRWGDGTTTRTTSRGAPPRGPGSIAHVWTHRGTATVGVDAHWTCDYRYTASGAIGTLTTVTSGAVTVPVDEVQPVLVR